MKKRIIFLLALVLVCASVLTACGKSSSLVGTTWMLTSAEAAGQVITGETLELSVGVITYEFKKDGVIEVTSNGDTAKASWSEDGDEIKITEEDTEFIATIEGDTLIMDVVGAKMTFTKK